MRITFVYARLLLVLFSHEFRKRHVFRAHVREIHDPSRMVRYFARITNFA